MRRAAVLAVCGVLLLALPSCAPAERSSTFFAMDTVMELSVYGDGELLTQAEEIVREMEASLSVTDPGSEIYALNKTGRARLSAVPRALIEKALEISALTDGALDITVYPAVRAWGFTTGEYRVPDADELAALLEKVDWSAVRVGGAAADGSAEVTLPEGAMADLGSVAKGAASDAIAERWRQAGVGSGLINLGGNVYALGKKPDGSPWRVGIRDPFGESVLGVLEAEDRAVVTSGGYERYFERDGKVYWHIIDPKTGCPADSGLASVTVVGPEGLLCDGLSTAVFVMGLEDACALWRGRGDFEMVLVADGGEVYVTEGLEDSFTLADGHEDTKVRVIRRG